MAIRVVQGLIDVGRSEPTRSPVSAASSPVSPATTNPTPQQTALSQQQVVTLSQSLSQVITYSDASVNSLRARGSFSDAGKLRDPEEASEVADSVAQRVLDGDDGGVDAHSTLSSTSARQHFTH